MAFDDCPDVRLAVPEDREAILDLMHMAHAECGSGHEISDEKLRWRIELGIQRQISFIGVIGAPGEPLAGYVLMIVEPIWYSDDVQLTELSNFVHPDHRRSTFAKQLVAFSKRCSESLGVDLLMSVVTTEQTEAKVRLFRRQMPVVGAFFKWTPANKGAA